MSDGLLQDYLLASADVPLGRVVITAARLTTKDLMALLQSR